MYREDSNEFFQGDFYREYENGLEEGNDLFFLRFFWFAYGEIRVFECINESTARSNVKYAKIY
jgi:hypothetical protein